MDVDWLSANALMQGIGKMKPLRKDKAVASDAGAFPCGSFGTRRNVSIKPTITTHS